MESHEAKPYMRYPKEWGLMHGLNCFFKGTPDFFSYLSKVEHTNNTGFDIPMLPYGIQALLYTYLPTYSIIRVFSRRKRMYSLISIDY